jgi:hypothetical protein
MATAPTSFSGHKFPGKLSTLPEKYYELSSYEQTSRCYLQMSYDHFYVYFSKPIIHNHNIFLNDNV